MKRLTTDRLEALLARVARVRVLVVGDLMLDVYYRGVASRISPEAPVPVVRVEQQWRALGGAANVATNVVALGAQCVVAGAVGADTAGGELRGELIRAGIDDAGVIELANRPTTVKTRIMARHQQVARFDFESDDDVDAEALTALAHTIEALAADADVIALEDYNKGVLTRPIIEAALAAGSARDIPVVVDPKSRFFFDYRGATVFKPNLLELSAALRDRVHADDPEWMERTRHAIGCEHLLLTLGEEGMALMTAGGEHIRIPTVARSVYDVSGAGDTVTAAVAVTLAAGGTPTEAAILANHAAGIEVGKAGVATVSPAELLSALQEHE